jgi:hypothetical protein
LPSRSIVKKRFLWRTVEANSAAGSWGILDRKAEVCDVAVFEDVVFTFQAEFAGLFAFRLATVNDEIIVGNDFGAD